jgi:dipeptidyl aminopeptidase/acylaminoacyl peptidase
MAHRRAPLAALLMIAVLAPPARSQTTPAALNPLVDRFVLDAAVVTAGDLSADGRWLAGTTSSTRQRVGIDNTRFQDPTYIAPQTAEVWVIETATAAARKLFPDKRQVRALKWSPDGSQLALFLLRGAAFAPIVWDRASGSTRDVPVPDGKEAADNAEFEWASDGSELFFAVRSSAWRLDMRKRFDEETGANNVVVHASTEPFLAWDDLRRSESIRSIVAYHVASGRSREVVPETRISNYRLLEDGSAFTYAEDVTKKTDYDTIFGVDNQIQVVPAQGGAARTVLKSTAGLTLQWSRDGKTYAYSKDGKVFVGSLAGGEPKQIAGPIGDTKDTKDPKDTKEELQKFSVVRVSPRGDRLVASDKKGLWLIETGNGSKALFVPMPEEDKEAPRYQVVDWAPDGNAIYLSYASRTSWERGVSRYEVQSQRLVDLIRDKKIYTNHRLSKDGTTFIFNAADGNRPADLYAATADFKTVHRLTTANPNIAAGGIARTELVSYLDVDGKKLYGVLYYPVNYQVGRRYPTVFEIYEEFFDDRFSGTINVLTQNGYAVMQPSVNLEIGHPGESWMKGVTAAANKLIEMGIADKDRLGVSGTSYGGYATALLITKTDRFKAAINISGKVDMISFYTDSPRLGVRNTHAPEKSQDRIGGTLWQQPMKYIEHSAIFAADRIKTPLLLMHGEQDHNVPYRQSMEMYYAMRRLGKEVKWVTYTRGGHGMPLWSTDDVYDYHRQIVSWWDEHLKADAKKSTDATKSSSGEAVR